ncbi:MAG: hypothetical protein HZC55_03860 [Verrucomicrobia bacterium]|nr:hypothetical protein [Verrucomicrobiota bacterium]
MHPKSVLFSGLLGVVAASSAQAITFGTFVQGGDLASVLSNNATIGFTYAGDKFVGSVYFGPNNNQLYSTDLNGGNVQKFGTPIAGFSGEVYVSASLGGGGFGPRDVYAGAESGGTVYRIANDGSSQGAFVSGLVGGVRSIAFDPYGLYGFNMIVATNAGNVYKVNSSGVATVLANVGEDAEGLSFAPLSFGGRPAGTLFVASEGSGTLRAINPDGTKQTMVTGLYGAEMVSFVPLNLGMSGNPVEGFYAAAYPQNIQKAAASEFTSYLGQAIITGETGHQVWAVNNSLQVTQLGFFPAQPEDGIFVTADVIHGNAPEQGSPLLLPLGMALLGYTARRMKRVPV